MQINTHHQSGIIAIHRVDPFHSCSVHGTGVSLSRGFEPGNLFYTPVSWQLKHLSRSQARKSLGFSSQSYSAQPQTVKVKNAEGNKNKVTKSTQHKFPRDTFPFHHTEQSTCKDQLSIFGDWSISNKTTSTTYMCVCL